MLKTVPGGATSEGISEALSLNNHSNVGVGISEGRGKGLARYAEHISEKVSPAILDPEEEMVTGVSTMFVIPKFTIK